MRNFLRCRIVLFTVTILLAAGTAGCSGAQKAAEGDSGTTPETTPAFLNEEQEKVFNDAVEIAGHFQVSTGYFGEYDGSEIVYYEHQKANGEVFSYYRECAKSAFSSYDAFYQYLLSAYTKEAADAMLAEDETYIDVDGALYAVEADRGTDITHCGTTYALVSETADALTFNVIGEYFDDLENPEAGTYFKTCPVTLVRTEDGWRAEEFALWY